MLPLPWDVAILNGRLCANLSFQVIPLVVIIGVAVAGLSGYCVYAGLTRPDVRWVARDKSLFRVTK